MAMERQDIRYRGHRIIANAKGAMIYPDKKMIEAESIESAVAGAKEYIDNKYQKRHMKRRETYIGTKDDYVEAFEALGLAVHEIDMLRAHKNANGRRLTATQLAEAAGWPSYSSANVHYGNLAKRISEQLGLSFPNREEEPWTLALGDYEEGSNEWIMHDEVAQALEHLNIA